MTDIIELHNKRKEKLAKVKAKSKKILDLDDDDIELISDEVAEELQTIKKTIRLRLKNGTDNS